MPPKKIIITAALLASLAACSLVLVMPSFNSDLAGQIFLIAMLAAIALSGKTLFARPKWSFYALAVVSLLSIPFVIIARSFGGVDVMALMFHIEFGAGGATLEGLDNPALSALVATFGFLLSAHMLRTHLKLGHWFKLSLTIALVLVNPLTVHFVTTLLRGNVSSFLNDRLAEPERLDGDIVLPDVVLVYLEGMESSLFLPALFPQEMAPIATLYQDGVRFEGVGQAEGTGWSMAGIFATQCGLPSLPQGSEWILGSQHRESYAPDVTCLGDIFEERGYSMEFLVGAPSDFASMDAFYRDHGNVPVIGMEHFGQFYDAETLELAQAGWILDDQLLFDLSRRRFNTLSASDEPIAMIVQSSSTHGDTVFASRNCTESGRGETNNDLRGAIRCLALELVSFVEFLRANAREGRPLAIAIMSDHFIHGKSITDHIDHSERENLVLLIDYGREGQVISRPATMFDVYPTILAWLGFAPENARAGLGVSLFSQNPTLNEELGLEALDDQLLYGTPPLALTGWRE